MENISIILYLSLGVSAKYLGPTLHWGVVIKVLLDLLHCMRTHVVGSVSRLSYGEKKKMGGGYIEIYIFTLLQFILVQKWLQFQNSYPDRTFFILHLHHLAFPLIKSGDVLGVFGAHTWICVCGTRGAQVLSQIMRQWELGQLLWRERKNSSHRIHAPYRLLECVRDVGFQVLRTVTSRRTQRNISVDFSTCSVNIGSVLQNNWRAAVVTKNASLPSFKESREWIYLFNYIQRFLKSFKGWNVNCTYLSLSYGLFSSSHSAGGRSESLTSEAATSKASPGTLKLKGKKTF